MKKALIRAVGMTALATAIATPAMAQDSDGEDEARRLGPVTVTAQRVEENLQDTPVAVTALSADQIEDKQVLNIRDLTGQVPNINIATNTGTASAARIFLRGVGEDESRGAVDQAVGIYVDGVYIGRSVGSLFDVVDLESIEVLRGPQGTLYGRNTVGGAIKLNSVRPQFENSGRVSATLGNYGRQEFRATGNVQMSDRTAFRITGFSRERDGFHELIPNGGQSTAARDDVGGLDTLAIRGSLYHEFNDDWNLLVAIDHTNDKSDPIPDSAAPGNDADNDIFTIEPLPGTTCPAGGLLPLGCFSDYDQELTSTGIMGRVEGTLGNLDFTSITAYRELEDELSTRIGFPYSQMTDQDQLSQEFTIGQSGVGSLDWIAGVYFFQEDLVLNSTFIFPFSIDSSTDSIAIFGQGTMEVNDRLSLTGGLRYTNDEKDFDGTGPFGFARTDSADFDNLSYTIGADYRIKDNVLGYAKYSTGFKSGGWSPDAFSGTAVFLPVEEETLDSFEVGLKTEWNDSLRINAAAFFNQYEGLQIGATVPGLGFTRFNVDETEISGLEIEAVWQITDNFQINGNAGFLDAEYTSLTGDQARGLSNNGAGCPAGVDPTVDSQIIACALDLDLKNAPSYKTSLGVLYSFPWYRGDLSFSGDMNFEDETWSLVANSPAHARIDFDAILNARIKYEDERGWSIAVFGRNLTDEEYYRASSASSFTTYASPPLEYGIEIGAEF
ncbi:MAG: TonB-dependent receptor [Pseudomonadota bacterium]|nr:TonB-dependent receptor [Pseudomonadota bacterium]